MTTLSIVAALFVGYIIGLMQKGIRIYHDDSHEFKEGEYNESVGNAEFTEYYDKHVRLNTADRED